ncbi:hypothetical protein GCM10010400_61240 [Streptomyces aculeolatus]
MVSAGGPEGGKSVLIGHPVAPGLRDRRRTRFVAPDAATGCRGQQSGPDRDAAGSGDARTGRPLTRVRHGPPRARAPARAPPYRNRSAFRARSPRLMNAT